MLPAFLLSAVSFDVRATPVLALSLPGGYEWIVIGAIGLLIFGKRLPDAARGLGESFRAFRKGMSGDVGAEGDADAEAANPAPAAPRLLTGSSQLTPRFDPHTGRPLHGRP